MDKYLDKQIVEEIITNIGIKRWEHSIRVGEVSKELAKIHGENIDKAYLAGLLHDCGKFQDRNDLLKNAKKFDIMNEEILLYNNELIHSPLGAEIAKKRYNIKDRDILNAIKYHTVGRPGMSNLEKIVFLADYIEPKRKFEGVENVRKLASKDLDEAVYTGLNQNLNYLISIGALISTKSLEARNSLIIDKRKGV